MEALFDNLSYLNPWRKSRLETYILKSCVSMFFSAVMIVASLIFLIDYMGISKALSVRADLSGVSIIGLLLEKSPSTILILLPFAFLFGALFAFVNLNRRSELIAMRAAGVSAWRFVMPAAILAFMFGVLTITVLNPVASILNDNYERVAGRLDSDTPVAATDTAIYLRQGNGREQVVIRAAGQDGSQIGHIKGVTFWRYNVDKTGIPAFVERIDADSAYLQGGFWHLKDAHDAQAGETSRYYETLSLPSNLDPQQAFKKYTSTQSVPFWRLPGLIHQSDISGFSSTDYRLKLHQLLSTPLMFAAMSALGAVFSLRLMRLGGMTRLVISGVSLGFVIFFINQLFSSMGKAGVIPVFLAGWTPPILAMLTAVTLLVYTEDG